MEHRTQNTEHRTRNTERGTQNTNRSVFRVPCSAQAGISLLELLIYVALLSGLMVIISDSFISLARGRGQAEARSEVHSAIRFAGERIRQDLKNASVVTTPALGMPGSTLQMLSGGTAVVYDAVAGQLRRTEGVNPPVPVTGTNIFVDAPVFTRIENYNVTLGATTTAIQVAMTFHHSASSTDWAYADTLRTTITLR